MIGITSNLSKESSLTINQDNILSIIEAHGVPFVLPNISDVAAIDRMAETIDGLLLTGGGDIDPTLFGEEPKPNLGGICPIRDQFEILLITRLLKMNKPILGICRGCQILNIAMGGDMYQDIYSQIPTELLQHQQQAPRWHASHFVAVEQGSLLHEITQSLKFKVNSYHHQAVRKVAMGFEISAKSSDGVIEAIESKEHRFVLGVQWHPENMTKKEEVYSREIFKAFIEACK